MTYEEIMQAAREATEGKCSVCRECDGRVCADRIPGPGSIGDVRRPTYGVLEGKDGKIFPSVFKLEHT